MIPAAYATVGTVSQGSRRSARVEVVRLYDRAGGLLRELVQTTQGEMITHWGQLVRTGSGAFALIPWPELSHEQQVLVGELAKLQDEVDGLFRRIMGGGGYVAAMDESYDSFMQGQTAYLTRLREEMEAASDHVAAALRSAGISERNWNLYREGWLSAGEMFASR